MMTPDLYFNPKQPRRNSLKHSLNDGDLVECNFNISGKQASLISLAKHSFSECL